MRRFSVSVPVRFHTRSCVWGVRSWVSSGGLQEEGADTLSKKEQDTLRDMRIVQEMYARGFDFLPLDIYTAKARHFSGRGGQADAFHQQY